MECYRGRSAYGVESILEGCESFSGAVEKKVEWLYQHYSIDLSIFIQHRGFPDFCYGSGCLTSIQVGIQITFFGQTIVL